MLFKLLFTVISLFIFDQSNAWVSVGSSPGFGSCTYSNIQAAIDSNEAEIRVLNDTNFPQNFEENLDIDHSVDIKGGFNTCFSASLNLLSSENAVIRGSGFLGSPVVKISASNNPIIRLYNITLRDASDTVFVANGGHGLDIGTSNGLIELNDSLIINNTAEDGGGIFIGATIGSVDLVLMDTSVFGNTASTRGGGIFCAENDTNIRISGASLIGENSAQDGGGIAALDGCTVTVDSGTNLSSGSELRGIIANTASQFGGGVYLNSAASLTLQGNKYGQGFLGNNTDPVTLANNTATSHGGGIYAINSAQIEVTDGLITNNSSGSSNGGGIYLGASSTTPVSFTMQSSNSQCWQTGKCSVLSNNHSSANGGGIYLKGGAEAFVFNTFIFGNRASFGTALYNSNIDGSGTSAMIEGSYFYSNGDDGLNGFPDNYVIRGNGNVTISLIHNTMANNNINDSNAVIGITGGSDLTIKNSLLDNFPETIFKQTGSNSLHISCTVASDLSSDFNLFPNSFVDSAHDDYHLASDSQAIDACAMTTTIFANDSDNQPRGWDDPLSSNFSGFYDAGADERIFSEEIFTNGFE